MATRDKSTEDTNQRCSKGRMYGVHGTRKRWMATVSHPQLNCRSNKVNAITLAFIYLACMQFLPQVESSDLAYRICEFVKFQKNCSKSLQDDAAIHAENATYCPGEYSSFVCWPNSDTGRIFATCWSFSDASMSTKIANRYCQSDGEWYVTEEGKIWQHLEDCNADVTPQNKTKEEIVAFEILQHFITAYIAGCAISLFCLILAIGILANFKKLHCTRNYIHLNLMISFILRYATSMIKDAVILANHNKSVEMEDATTEGLYVFCDEYERGFFVARCRIAVLLQHYAIISNYFWLLVEGLYLQMLLSLFRVIEDKCFKAFMAFGWGGPWLFVGLWAYLRLHDDEAGCWQTKNSRIEWALNGPVLVSIILNFVIFVNIIRIIVSKLRQHNMTRKDDKFRLAKSTLALIPLLGIHYILFFLLSQDQVEMNAIARRTIDGVQMFFVATQGTLVAVLYCFMNGEVKTVVKKWWNVRKWKNSLPRGQSRSRTESMVYHQNGNSHTSGTYVSKRSPEGKDIELQSFSHCCTENGTSEFNDANGNSKRSSDILYYNKPSTLIVPEMDSADRSTTSLLSNGASTEL